MDQNATTDLQSMFEMIRRDYFPRWDRHREWRIIYTPDLLSIGLCSPDKKVIQLSINEPADVSLQVLIIHEICHAFSLGHGVVWKRRLATTAQQADKLGNTELAHLLREHIEDFSRPLTVSRSADIYNRITDFVSETDKPVTFDSVMAAIASEVGGGPAELIKEFPRARKVYDKAMRDAERDRKNTERLLRAMQKSKK